MRVSIHANFYDSYMSDVADRCVYNLSSPAVDPEDASSEVEMVGVDEVNQWL